MTSSAVMGEGSGRPAAIKLRAECYVNRFAGTAVRLQFRVRAYTSPIGCARWRRPKIGTWSLTALRGRLVKTGPDWFTMPVMPSSTWSGRYCRSRCLPASVR